MTFSAQGLDQAQAHCVKFCAYPEQRTIIMDAAERRPSEQDLHELQERIATKKNFGRTIEERIGQGWSNQAPLRGRAKCSCLMVSGMQLSVYVLSFTAIMQSLDYGTFHGLSVQCPFFLANVIPRHFKHFQQA